MTQHIEQLAIDNESPDRVLMDQEEAVDDSMLVIPENGQFDWLRVRIVCDFAARNPARWRTIAARMDNPELSLKELARLLRVTERTVRRHLDRLRIISTEF